MAILIMNMTMPEVCDKCNFYNDDYDYPYCIVTQTSRGYNYNPRIQRMKDCPLKEVELNGTSSDLSLLQKDI